MSSRRPRVVALVSSYREGPMLATAVRSAAALDAVVVFEGPVEGSTAAGPRSELGDVDAAGARVWRVDGSWETDADKRTAMLTWARRKWQGPLWGLWLDGDEVLLWGEYLHDWLWRVEQQGTRENPVGGWPLPLVELDGSVSWCMGKLLRLDLVRRYLVSSSYIELVNGDRRTVGNVPAWDPLDGPLHRDEKGRPHWRARPPLAGEPHLQHRPILRDRGRLVERQHVAEERNYRRQELVDGFPDT